VTLLTVLGDQTGRIGLNVRRLTMMVVLAFLCNAPAFAYIDPNTGGFLFQLLAPLAAIALSVWMFFANQVKAIWRSICSVFRRMIDNDK